MTRFDMEIALRVLRQLAPNSVECFTEIKSMRGDAFFYSPRATGIRDPCGMRKLLNRVGDAFGWPKVRQVSRLRIAGYEHAPDVQAPEIPDNTMTLFKLFFKKL